MDYIAEIRNNLLINSMGYLEIGLKEFHKLNETGYIDFQPALGNLSVSIELMLKTIIAHNAFEFLFTNLPNDFKVYLKYPQLIKDNVIKRTMAIKFLHSTFNTIDISECISIFNIIHADKKNEFSGYFRTLSIARNASIHFIMPKFQKYDLGKVANLALLLFKIIDENKEVYKNFYYSLKDKDKKFIIDFSSERVEIVKEKIEEAKKKAVKTEDVIIDSDSWDEFVSKCPICHNDCLLYGNTIEDADIDDDGIGQVFLTFNADMLKCNQCGLILNDIEELKLSNVEIAYDRSDELDVWNDGFYLKYYDVL